MQTRGRILLLLAAAACGSGRPPAGTVGPPDQSDQPPPAETDGCIPEAPGDAGNVSVRGTYAGCPEGSHPATPGSCKFLNIDEPGMLAAFEPKDGERVAANGRIKVWVNDEAPPFIAPNEVVDPTTGAIVTPGDRTARASDGLLYEPAIYIAPDSMERHGRPYFPTEMRGYFAPGGSTTPTIVVNGDAGSPGPPIDPPPPGTVLDEAFTAEYVWDVSSLGLSPGTYIAEFVVHDGDFERAFGCLTIVIEEPLPVTH